MKVQSIYSVLIVTFLSCQFISGAGKEGKPIASIYDKVLYYEEVEPLFPENLNAQDSSAFVHSYIDKWLRDQVIIIEAEKYVAQDINIDRLVENYRASLLTYNYEKRLVEDRLDTVITEEAYARFYEQEKEQFILSEPILLYERFRIPAKAKRIDFFFSNWRNNRSKKIKDYIEMHAVDYEIDTLNYIEANRFLNQLPNVFQEKDLKRTKAQHYHDGYEYFVKIIDYKDKGEIPPLSYIKETLRKRILNERKNALLKSVKEKLLDMAVESNKVHLNYKEK